MLNHIKNNKGIAIAVLAAMLTLVFYFWFSKQPYFEAFGLWAKRWIWFYMIVLVFMKALAIVWPPLPGGLFTLGSVAIIGWKYAFLGQVIGGLLGGSIAFFLGRKYGYWLLAKFFDDSIIEKLKNVKIFKHREFEAIFFLRVFTGAISEAISYGAGLIGIHYRNFILATLCAFVIEMPIFYLAGSVLTGGNWFLTGPIVLIGAFAFYKLQGRYFE